MFVLIRHPVADIPPGICYGRLDAKLAKTAEIGDIVGRLAALSAFSLWSSPASRCLAVARAVATTRGVRIRLDDRLLELDFGAWEGRPWSDVPRADLDRWAACPAGFAAPGGESGESLIARVAAFHDEVETLPGAHVIVSHGGPLRVLAALLRGQPVDLLAPPPELGSVLFIGRSEAGAGDAEHGALGDRFGRAEHVAGVAADLRARQR